MWAVVLRTHGRLRRLHPLVWQACQGVSTSSQPDRLAGYRKGSIPPRLVPFQVSLKQAHDIFHEWHGDKWLAPTKMLQHPSASVRPVLLPFWLFEAAIRVEYTGVLGFPVEEGKPSSGTVWKETHWRDRGYQEYPWTLGSMQVYASYTYRRDLTEAAKEPGMLSRTRVLKAEEAARGLVAAARSGPTLVDLDAPAMRQAIAWEFALRNIRTNEAAEAERALKRETGAELVRDVQVRIRTLRRRARLVYLPAFMIDYTFGEYFNAHNERRAEKYQAVVSGMGNTLAGERHYDPAKAQVAAGALVGGASLLVSMVAVPWLGMDLGWSLGVEGALALFLACTGAGVGAKLWPQIFRTNHERQRRREEIEDLEKFMTMGLGPLDAADNEQEVIRTNADWRRWEESDKWRWDPEKRQRWAEALWRNQQSRRLQRKRIREQQDLQLKRQRLEAEFEARRRQKWGHASHHAQFAAGDRHGLSAGGRRDFLGYYKMLGLQAESASITEVEIKVAFRKAAHRWHPDKQKVADETARNEAKERFHQLRLAYEVLRDPEKRRQYDNGQVVVL
ncbi:hypothetical protein WJX72_000065 [[Myrmecia] bisecta]|uniref:J domain-containing protein n=1 Tax=[Myrmecia] bisecta TaxID=41462 RepID=A0AAW1Q047_9CHLO